ncbi:MAG: arylamine N-acetyltransferase, partial [Gaiellaceae bacterium]
MRRATVVAVLDRLGTDRPAPGLAGLRSVYAAWCRAVPFDNALKLIHVAERRSGPLPGSTADDFFDVWLEHGAGGTCWAGNNALHDLLEALGFDVARAIAT